MKMTIDGMVIEGTPDELMAFLQKKNSLGEKPYEQMPPELYGGWHGIFPPPSQIGGQKTLDPRKKICYATVCNCTGDCQKA